MNLLIARVLYLVPWSRVFRRLYILSSQTEWIASALAMSCCNRTQLPVCSHEEIQPGLFAPLPTQFNPLLRLLEVLSHKHTHWWWVTECKEIVIRQTAPQEKKYKWVCSYNCNQFKANVIAITCSNETWMAIQRDPLVQGNGIKWANSNQQPLIDIMRVTLKSSSKWETIAVICKNELQQLNLLLFLFHRT